VNGEEGTARLGAYGTLGLARSYKGLDAFALHDRLTGSTPRFMTRLRRLPLLPPLAGFVLLFVLAAPVAGQVTDDAARGGFWAGVGALRHGQSDAMASPYRYRGTAPLAAVGYRRVGDRTRLGVDASISGARLRSALSRDHFEDVVLASLEAWWARRVVASGPWSGFAGAQLALHLPYRDHSYGSLRTEQFGDLFAPVELLVAHEYRLGPGTVASQRVGVPVVAIVLRSPYTGLKYAPDVTVAPPGRLVGLDHAVLLDRALSETWGLRAEWRTTLLRYPDPQELALVTHRVALGVELHP